MASLEMITVSRVIPAKNGLSQRVSDPEEIKMVGWVCGWDAATIMLAAALTPDGPSGVTIIPIADIRSRVALIGWIPSENITMTLRVDG